MSDPTQPDDVGLEVWVQAGRAKADDERELRARLSQTEKERDDARNYETQDLLDALKERDAALQRLGETAKLAAAEQRVAELTKALRAWLDWYDTGDGEPPLEQALHDLSERARRALANPQTQEITEGSSR